MQDSQSSNGKILLVSANFYPKIGGPSSSVPEIAQILVKSGFVVDIVTSQFPNLPVITKQDGYTIHRGFSIYNNPAEKNVLKDIAATIGLSIKIRELNKVNKYNIIHTHDCNISLLAARLSRIKAPIVAKFTGDIAIEQQFANISSLNEFTKTFFTKKSNPNWMLHAIQKRMLNWPSIITCPSKAIFNQLEKFDIPIEKRKTLYNGISFNASLSHKKNGASSSFSLLYFGRLVPWKGVHILLQAFDKVAQSNNITLTIIGSGSSENELKKMASRLESSGKIKFIGLKTRSETMQYVQKCDAVVLPSFYDPFPHSMIETLAYAKPLIATRVDGIPEVIINKKTGWLIEPNSVESLADAILELINNPQDRNRIAEQGQKAVLRSFTWEKIVKQLIEIYAQINPVIKIPSENDMNLYEPHPKIRKVRT